MLLTEITAANGPSFSRLPFSNALAKSPASHKRARRSKRAIAKGRSGGETLATLGATTGKHQSPALRLHARAKPVGALAAHAMRLEGTFHDAVKPRNKRSGSVAV